MAIPDFLVIGHVAKDVDDESWRLGGTAAYASLQAARLGLRAAIITRAASDIEFERLLPGVDALNVSSETTTVFQNRYENGRRVQRAWSQAGPIGAEHVPQEWRSARMVLLGPLLRETPIEMTRLFSNGLVGVCPQGWLRDRRPDGQVVRRAWSELLRGVDLVFVSDEDIGDQKGVLEVWSRQARIVVVTESRHGARISFEGRWRHIAAFPHNEVDPTGAGDVFAAAFMIAFDETQDVAQAARFAVAAAGLSVEGEGAAAVPGREAIERALATHPEVVLK